MTRTAIRIATLLAALASAWQPSAARAADEDVQLWNAVFLTGELDEDTRLTIDASHRWREAGRGGEQQTIRATVEQTIAPGIRIGGGAALFEAGGVSEFRPHQQVTFVVGRFDFRTRMEERFIDGADRAELRLRQRIQYNQPLGRGWRASLGGEWLGRLQGRQRSQGTATDQWRAQTGIAYRIGPHVEIGANYWLIAAPRGPRPARLTHVPQTVLTVRF